MKRSSEYLTDFKPILIEPINSIEIKLWIHLPRKSIKNLPGPFTEEFCNENWNEHNNFCEHKTLLVIDFLSEGRGTYK